MRQIVTVGVACGLATLTILACSDRANDEERSDPGEVGALGMALYGDFGDASVRVTGVRTPSADGVYSCENSFANCLNFNSDGGAQVIQGLCPSENIPAGTWTFSYELFKGANCPGSPIPNVDCPPTTGQTLPAGTVTIAQVTCSSN